MIQDFQSREVNDFVVADLDGDFIPEIISSEGSVLSIYKNNGTGFIESSTLPNAGALYSMVLVDSDGNGAVEIYGVDTLNSQIKCYSINLPLNRNAPRWRMQTGTPHRTLKSE